MPCAKVSRLPAEERGGPSCVHFVGQVAMVCRKPLQQREVAIIRRMKNVLGLPVTQIALATDRNKSTVYKALDTAWRFVKRGRPSKLTKKDVAMLVRTLKAMQQKARARKEITLAMFKR